MPTPLISIGDLVRLSWTDFLKRWRHALDYSIRYLVASLVVFAGALVARSSDALALPATLASGIVAGLIALHATILLGRLILIEDKGGTFDRAKEAPKAWHLFLPFLWVNILRSLATVGGLALLVLPGIWLSVLLFFSSFLVLEGEAEGTQALAASAHLVKGRWWAVCWRLIVANAFFALLSLIVLNIVELLLGLFIGFDALQTLTSVNIFNADPLSLGLTAVLNGIAEALFLPLLLTVNIKLYHSLKASR